MTERYTVIGGWGISPQVLQPVFGSQSTYIDVNHLMPAIINNTVLRSDWREYLASVLRDSVTASPLLAGWSTGAIIAAACTPFLPVRALVLLSATPSFCRTSGFRHGMRPAVLQNMRTRLATEPDNVIEEFKKQCGLCDTSAQSDHYAPEELQCGLEALEHMSVPDTSIDCPVIIFHGTHDRIIPFEAGKLLNDRCNGTFVPLAGPHACFIDNTETIKSTLTTFHEGRKHEPV